MGGVHFQLGSVLVDFTEGFTWVLLEVLLKVVEMCTVSFNIKLVLVGVLAERRFILGLEILVYLVLMILPTLRVALV